MADKKKTSIHELIPAENDRVNAANSLVDEAVTTFTKRNDHFLGHVRKVAMFDADREAENTTDVKEVVDTVPGKLDHVWKALVKAIDITATKDNSNTSSEARADVIVDGEVVLSDIPATALLSLEKKLGQLKGLYQTIPTLDPSLAWEPDSSAAMSGVYRTAHQQEAYKTEKVLEHKVLYEATKEHPAQIEKYTVDRNVAKVTVNRQSGMVSPADKAAWLARISSLQTAVRSARQRANMAAVLDLKVGKAIRDFIHKG